MDSNTDSHSATRRRDYVEPQGSLATEPPTRSL